MGGLTWTYREAKAAKLERQARKRRAELRAGGATDAEVREGAKWYADRAKGQRSRVGNVLSCQRSAHVLRISCQACGSSKDHPVRCGAGLLCVSCRGKIAEGRRARIMRARDVVMHAAKRAGLLRLKRRGGQWRERFVTLTVPHFEDLGVEERIDLVAEMWPHFRRSLAEWMRENHRKNVQFSAWYRGQEWTVGKDRKGHPHVHFWMFGPFLPHELVEDWWRAALERCGRTYDKHMQLRVDEANADTIREVVKYIVKDLDDGGELVDAALYAQVYEAIDGRRMSQGSKGFLKKGDRAARCACGAEGCYLSQLVPSPTARVDLSGEHRTEVKKARGHPPPPLQAIA